MVFSEDSRVKIPCILHLVRLGYRYLSLKNAIWDEETNIFPTLFNEAIARTGAQQPHISKGVLDESHLVIPDDATLSAYTEKAAPLLLKIKNNLQKNQQLTQLRDWLLPLLMNGQVKVA